MIRKKMRVGHTGFTLVELIIGLAIIGLLASIVIAAVNPRKQLTAVRDAWRQSMVNEVQKSIVQYNIANGNIPSGILAGTCQKRPICRFGMSTQANCVNLDSIISSDIMVDLPVDESEGSGALTGFTAYTTPNGNVTIESSYLGMIGTALGSGRESLASTITGCPCYTCGCMQGGTYPMSTSDGPINAMTQGTNLYTLDSNSRTVTVVDQSTDHIVTTIPVGQNPVGIVIVNGSLYVLNRDNNSITIISTATNTVTNTITGIGNSPNYMTVVGTKLYISNYAGASILVFDTATNTVTATIAGMSNPGASILVGTKLYVWNPTANAIKVIDTTNNTVSATISGLQQGGAFVPYGTYLYALSGGSYVYKIDTSNNTIVATMTTVGSNPVYGLIIGSKLYTMNYSGGSISIIDVNTNAVSTIVLGGAPIHASPSSDNTKLYILRRTGNAVTILNTTTDTVIQTLNFGKEPYISVPYGRRLYLIFYTGAKHIEVLDTSSDIACT